MPMLPYQWNNSAAQASLAPAVVAPEYYIPLWWYSGSVFAPAILSAPSSSYMLAKCSTSSVASTSGQTHLHTLNALWSSTTLFAFEISFKCSTSLPTAYAQLYDITANTAVLGSQVSTTSKTLTIVRSGQFSLSPGHIYGVVFWGSNNSYGSGSTDASLIVFPQ